MDKQIGIQETKELLDFGFKLQEGIISAMEDNKASLLDIPAFVPAIMSAPKAFANVHQVLAELKDLNSDERTELLEFARERFDLPDNDLEIIIEDTLEVILLNVKIATRWANRTKAA